MSKLIRATILDEVIHVVQLEPLEANDACYTNLGKARSSSQLQRMRRHLLDSKQKDIPFIHVAFVGHHGGGKTTELRQLEKELAAEGFVPIHLDVDRQLQEDADYPDLLLWLVDSLVAEFQQRGWPLERSQIEGLTRWFGERTIESDETTKKQIQLEAGAGGGIGGDWFGTCFKLRSFLKSSLSGNVEQRVKFRRVLRQWTADLIDRVNKFLTHARAVLAAHGQPGRLLIVQDNLDRLQPEAAKRLFIESGKTLLTLQADFIWTAPVNMKLAPFRLDAIFDTFHMPIPAPRLPNGTENQPAVAGLLELIAKRMDIAAVFDSPETARRLCFACGGSLRDLLRLIQEARLTALVEEKPRMDAACVREAIQQFRLNYERSLIPGNLYYPVLAEIHLTKHDPAGTEIEAARERFSELIFNGSVFQYNGQDTWYDVHPVILEIPRFQAAHKVLRDSQQRIQPA